MHRDQQYFAIVHEYIPQGESYAAAVQSQIDFFWRMGFDFSSSPRPENWKSGMLVDYPDIVSPWGYGWYKTSYRRREDVGI
ncbi:hypothetical protein G6O67_006131 [Ophiocordyceps sinensis]|uniref:Uncharacterized protein n=2 Tax=Ophiocordyceps sinensis TaxID=72228 RepID=A0A8H4PK37_9HYPO|nr:hypothetical protein OCS_06123 [Ophiocordyceps sinensis CO18]KAF4506002.1 hypothetical protein G6O67_006131 [Ophiocordyceps sinensis]